MRRRLGLLVLTVVLAIAPRAPMGQLEVVTSTTDLCDIAKQVGGDRIEASHIGEGNRDPHFTQAKPDLVLQLRGADVWAFVGLDLEVSWMPLLLDGARNPKVRLGGAGYLDMSRTMPVVDMPQGRVQHSTADAHPLGNPHYWLDPENGRRIAQSFKVKFSQLDPANAATYDGNEKAFEARLDAAEKGWQGDLAAIRGKPVVAWHTSWRYFAEYNHMNIVAFMESMPGVPPTPSHLYEVIEAVKRTGARAIIMEPFYDRNVAELVAKQTGVQVLLLPSSVGGAKGMDDYIQLMKYDMAALAAVVK